MQHMGHPILVSDQWVFKFNNKQTRGVAIATFDKGLPQKLVLILIYVANSI